MVMPPKSCLDALSPIVPSTNLPMGAERSHSLICACLAIAVFPIASTAASPSTSTITPAGDAIKAGDRLALKADAAIFRGLHDGSSVLYCAPAFTVFSIDSIDAAQTNTTAEPADGSKLETSISNNSKTGATTTTVKGAKTVVQEKTDTTLYLHIKSVGKAPTSVTDKSSSRTPGFLNFLGAGSRNNPLCDGLQLVAQTPAAPTVNEKNAAQTPAPPASADKSGGDSTTAMLVSNNTEYTTTVTQLSHYGLYREGLTWGALTIPYKYEFHDHSFQAKPTIAAYGGYESWLAGASVAGVVALGIGASSQSTTPSTGSGTSPTNSSSGGTLALYTIGTGLMFTFGGSFKGGLLVGRDYAGSTAGYKYEGRTWMALSLGAGF